MRKSELTLLSFHEKLFLLGLARIFKESQRAYVTFAEAKQAYAVVCEEFNVKAHSHTQLWNYLQSLSALGVVKTEVSRVSVRGRSTLIYLPRIPAHELDEELQILLERKGDEKLWK